MMNPCEHMDGLDMDLAHAAEEIESLRATIKQYEAAEPVAWMDDDGCLINETTHPENYIPLYAAPVAPAGWKLVPIEPTKEMLWQICPASADLHEWAVNYEAMLKAAPKP